MPSFRELLAATKAQVREVDTAEAEAARERPGTEVLDVREPEENAQGAIPGSRFIARGQAAPTSRGGPSTSPRPPAKRSASKTWGGSATRSPSATRARRQSVQPPSPAAPRARLPCSRQCKQREEQRPGRDG